MLAMFSTAVLVFPHPRPARINQTNQSPVGNCWSGRPQNDQSCSRNASSSGLRLARNLFLAFSGREASKLACDRSGDFVGCAFILHRQFAVLLPVVDEAKIAGNNVGIE